MTQRSVSKQSNHDRLLNGLIFRNSQYPQIVQQCPVTYVNHQQQGAPLIMWHPPPLVQQFAAMQVNPSNHATPTMSTRATNNYTALHNQIGVNPVVTVNQETAKSNGINKKGNADRIKNKWRQKKGEATPFIVDPIKCISCNTMYDINMGHSCPKVVSVLKPTASTSKAVDEKKENISTKVEVDKTERPVKKKMSRLNACLKKIQSQEFPYSDFLCDMCLEEGDINHLKEHVTEFHLNSDNFRFQACSSCCLLIIAFNQKKHFTSVHHRSAERELTVSECYPHWYDPKGNCKVLKLSGLKHLSQEYHLLQEMECKLSPIVSIRLDDDCVFVDFANSEVVDRCDEKIMTDRKFSYKLEKCVQQGAFCINKNLKKYLTNRENLINYAKELSSEAEKLYKNYDEAEKLKLLQQHLFATVQRDFPKAIMYPFGSRITGLTLSQPDLDLYMDIGGTFEGKVKQSPKEQVAILDKVLKDIKSKPSLFTAVTCVRGARVPIVRFKHVPTQISCDLSFLNGLSVRNTELIRFIVGLDKRIRPLYLFLREWIELNDLSKLVTSYALFMMLIAFLADEEALVPIIPTVMDLQSKHLPEIIGGWNAGFCKNREEIEERKHQAINNDDLFTLLKKFFKFYSTFSYADLIICPFTGRPLLRSEILACDCESGSLPIEIKKKILEIPIKMYDQSRPICVMDPFDFSHNLTKGIGVLKFPIIVKFFYLSWEMMESHQ